MGADLLERARARAAHRAETYRRTGRWTAEPLDLVAARAASPDVALVDREGPVTFADLEQLVAAAATRLVAHGAGPGVPVLLAVGNDRASVIAFHAAVRVDAVVLLVPLSVGRSHLQEIVRSSGAVLGVAPGAWLEENVVPGPAWMDVGAVTVPVAGCADVADGAGEPLAPRRPADEPSVVLYTSGTTSRPKGVVHSLATLRVASENYVEAARLRADDRILLISPLASVTGVLQGLLIGPLLGIPVVLEDRWSPAGTYRLLIDSGASWYGGPDLLLDRLLDEAAAAGRSAVPLRAVYLGGTMLDRRVVERVEREFGIVVMRAYGSSEVPVSTSGLRKDPRALRHGDDGVPLADVDLRIGSELDPGECCIAGPHTFLGYVDPEDDAAVRDDGWFHTGDVAELHRGRLRIVGRLRDIVIRNGLKIPVAEVEDAVNRLPGVDRSAGYSVTDARTGERLVLAVRLKPGNPLTLSQVVAAMEDAGLPRYKAPEELVFWSEEFPVNATGKVERNRLEGLGEQLPRERAVRLTEGTQA